MNVRVQNINKNNKNNPEKTFQNLAIGRKPVTYTIYVTKQNKSKCNEDATLAANSIVQ